MDKKKIIIAFLLLLMTVLINIPTLLNGTFVDEFDTLAAAKLMTTKGQILYRDIFSHHFPLSYYWTALIFKLFGTSVFVARMSLVGLYVFVFFTLMLLTKKWIELSLVSFIWGALRILYFGNMIIYPSFSAIFILGYGVLGLHALSLEEEPPWHYWPIMSFFAILAFMSDPLSVYPAIIIGICLLTRKIGYGLRFGLFFGGFLSLLILGLSIGGVLSDLFEGAFHFNRSFYSKYTWTNPIRIKEFLLQIVTLLDLFQQKWFNLNPLRSFPLDITKIDEWAFTGLFYRLSIYFYATILFIQKKWLTAVSVFVFAAAILAMKTTGFYAQVFNLFALYCFVSFVSNLFKKEEKKPLKK